ncbi:hypothetical protein Tco_0996585 [Tanacetum coccineum]
MLGCAETKVATWDDLAFKLIILGSMVVAAVVEKRTLSVELFDDSLRMRSNACRKSNSTSPPYNGSDSNGQNDSVGSTITPLLGKSGKQETRKMMDHVISVREYGKADEHRKYGDKSVSVENLLDWIGNTYP